MSGAEVTVLATHGGFFRRAACALGLHEVRELLAPFDGGPGSIRFCRWCGQSDDPRWDWACTQHRGDLGGWISFVVYRGALA